MQLSSDFTPTPRIAILGTGAWGTAFAQVLADAGHPSVMWGRSEATVADINTNHHNSSRLPGFPLSESISATTDITEAVSGADVVVVAVPAQSARSVLEQIESWPKEVTLVSLMKGVELSSDLRMSEVLVDATGVDSSQIVVVSGPNLAKEIAAKQPTATVMACEDAERAKRVAALTITDYFRPYLNTDVIGVELAGAVKNVIAIAVGMAVGAGFGDNTKATLITRGLAEITRLALKLGADPKTMAGLAGMGDLVATCASPLSRNHTFGAHLARGMSLEEAITAAGGTVEGVKTSRSVQHLARSVGVEMPLTDAVVDACFDGVDLQAMMKSLLSRPHKDERR
ncbi:glycerol-3-phosphate dehydrogenase [Bowdeniella nasicola]|uniref:Glycerol-3-phosphate dehydrogenase [NAD(P)+] n=1 Tax=Bowdeniella nasicola TaxID=208480 RepID=A0A1Q5Q495_9ACTO|nr:NAD(P)H-dependent glycerol-3-phosphate dehydrogenase [Bowdeniella nasicola]OKL54648.1 glycerol-3-phosphate dehydrogenase [Bowdeniella nasicola]